MDLTGLSIVPPQPSISVSARARADSQPRRMAAHPRQISVECAQISKHPCMAREYMGIAYMQYRVFGCMEKWMQFFYCIYAIDQSTPRH